MILFFILNNQQNPSLSNDTLTFEEVGLCKDLSSALLQLGFEHPTSIQVCRFILCKHCLLTWPKRFNCFIGTNMPCQSSEVSCESILLFLFIILKGFVKYFSWFSFLHILIRLLCNFFFFPEICNSKFAQGRQCYMCC